MNETRKQFQFANRKLFFKNNKIMNWLLILITLIIIAVLLLELWTVLRRVPHEASVASATPPFSPSTIPTTTSIATPIQTDVRETQATQVSQEIQNVEENDEMRDARIKEKLKNIVARFKKENVNLDDMLRFGRETAKEFEEAELEIYEPFIANLMKEKCKPWPIMTQLALYRHGKQAKQILIEEKRNGSF